MEDRETALSEASLLNCFRYGPTSVSLGCHLPNDRRGRRTFYFSVSVADMEVVVPSALGVGPPSKTKVSFRQELALSEAQVIELAKWIHQNLGNEAAGIFPPPPVSAP